MTVIKKFSGEFRFLSNFWPGSVQFEGIEFSSVEHAYQAAKFLDVELRITFSKLASPGKAKREANKLKDQIRPDWHTIKVEVMRELVRQKFVNHKDLGARLVGTGNCELIEGNTWGDTFWGICKGVGDNHLGKILMDIRRELTLTG